MRLIYQVGEINGCAWDTPVSALDFFKKKLLTFNEIDIRGYFQNTGTGKEYHGIAAVYRDKPISDRYVALGDYPFHCLLIFGEEPL